MEITRERKSKETNKVNNNARLPEKKEKGINKRCFIASSSNSDFIHSPFLLCLSVC
jgi:hypothetical protein